MGFFWKVILIGGNLGAQRSLGRHGSVHDAKQRNGAHGRIAAKNRQRQSTGVLLILRRGSWSKPAGNQPEKNQMELLVESLGDSKHLAEYKTRATGELNAACAFQPGETEAGEG